MNVDCNHIHFGSSMHCWSHCNCFDRFVVDFVVECTSNFENVISNEVFGVANFCYCYSCLPFILILLQSVTCYFCWLCYVRFWQDRYDWRFYLWYVNILCTICLVFVSFVNVYMSRIIMTWCLCSENITFCAFKDHKVM